VRKNTLHQLSNNTSDIASQIIYRNLHEIVKQEYKSFGVCRYVSSITIIYSTKKGKQRREVNENKTCIFNNGISSCSISIDRNSNGNAICKHLADTTDIMVVTVAAKWAATVVAAISTRKSPFFYSTNFFNSIAAKKNLQAVVRSCE
jgi:hypothetical protein